MYFVLCLELDVVLSSLESVHQCETVDIVDVASIWQPTREASHFHICGKVFAEIEGCSLSFKVGICCNDDFIYTSEPREKCLKREISWTTAMEWGERTSEYVIESFVCTSLFYREEICVFLDDTDDILVSFVIATITTFGCAHILQRSAPRAGVNIFVDIDELL